MNFNQIINNDLKSVIFGNLDLCSLMKSKGVCKEWKNIIDTRFDLLRLDNPVRRTIVAKLFVKEYLDVMLDEWNMSLSQTPKEEYQQEEGHPFPRLELISKFDDLEKGFIPEGVDDLTSKFSLQELISLLNIYKCQAIKKMFSIEFVLGMESCRSTQKSKTNGQVDKAIQELAKDILVTRMCHVLKEKFHEELHIDIEDPSKEIPVKVKSCLLSTVKHMVLPMCRMFTAEEMEKMSEVLKSPAAPALAKIVKSFFDKILPFLPVY